MGHCLLLVLLASEAMALGPTGHRITGEIAEHFLTPESEHAIRNILDGDSLVKASTWADEMRSNPADFWQNRAGFYHYVTVPPGKTYADIGPPPEGDALSALKMFRTTLENPDASKKEKALALRFTVHIIGDLHQPLHVGNGVDRGGNDFEILFFGKKSNLHRVWDSGLLAHPKRHYSEWTTALLKGMDKTSRRQWHSVDPQAWVTESARIRDTIYPETRQISRAYLKHHLPTLKTRLQQAGFRMALYLNELFANQ